MSNSNISKSDATAYDCTLPPPDYYDLRSRKVPKRKMKEQETSTPAKKSLTDAADQFISKLQEFDAALKLFLQETKKHEQITMPDSTDETSQDEESSNFEESEDVDHSFHIRIRLTAKNSH